MEIITKNTIQNNNQRSIQPQKKFNKYDDDNDGDKLIQIIILIPLIIV